MHHTFYSVIIPFVDSQFLPPVPKTLAITPLILKVVSLHICISVNEIYMIGMHAYVATYMPTLIFLSYSDHVKAG